MTGLAGLTGQVFGRLTVLSKAQPFPPKAKTYWLVRCECGSNRIVREDNLLTGRSTSCKSGKCHASWRGQDVSYSGAHNRIHSLRGSATDYDCKECGHAAKDWSLDWKSIPPDSIKWGRDKPAIDKLSPYSANPEDYSPRCRRCHHAYDSEDIAGMFPLPA